jgi:hypothetical protein
MAMRQSILRLAHVGRASGDLPPFLVVRARGGFWRRWLHRNDPFPGYGALAQESIAVGQWDSLDDWVRVSEELCEQCGHPVPLCLFCEDEAIYFLDGDFLKVTVYLCSDCGEPFDEVLAADGADRGAWQGVELALYACCDCCVCDHWR